MSLKKSYLLLLLIAFAAICSCQKDIPVLGEDQVATKSTVYIRSITLFNFPSDDPNSMLPWDFGSTVDSVDSLGPDIFYYFNYKEDTLAPFYYSQSTHFQNIEADSSFTYYLTDTVAVPNYYFHKTFYLKVADLDVGVIQNDTNLIDSIPISIGPDTTLTNPYINSVSGTGFNGSQVTVGLEWK